MQAQINLFLKDDNSYQGIFDGTPINFGMMLHKMAKLIWRKIEEMNPEQ